MFDFGLQIRRLREKYRMSQEELGRRVERSKSVISSYENNIKVPPLSILIRLAGIFNCSLDYLVGFEKAEMISVDGLTDEQKGLIQTIAFEFKDNKKPCDGLSERQQEILNLLIKEFAKK